MRRIAVIGLGLMGGSFAAALRARRPELWIAGIDRDQATLSRARELGLVDVTASDFGPVAEADLVMLAVPINQCEPVLRQLAGSLDQARTLVSDMASVKVPVMESARLAGVTMVGGHPICGSERSGIAAADAGLFEDATWTLTHPSPAIEDVVRLVGARPVVMEAALHDRLLARTSHAAFLVAAACVLSAEGTGSDLAKVVGPGFRDLTRLAAGNTELYADIVHANRANIVDAVDDVTRELQKLSDGVRRQDAEVVDWLTRAKELRALLLGG